MLEWIRLSSKIRLLPSETLLRWTCSVW